MQGNSMEKKDPFPHMVLDLLGIHVQKNEP